MNRIKKELKEIEAVKEGKEEDAAIKSSKKTNKRRAQELPEFCFRCCYSKLSN
jgi:hypothetical protein